MRYAGPDPTWPNRSFVATPRAVAYGAVYVALTFLFEASYGYGLIRGIVMCGLLALMPVVAANTGARLWRCLSSRAWLRIAVMASLVPLGEALASIPTVYHVRVLDGLVATGLILALGVLATDQPLGGNGRYRNLALLLVSWVLVIPVLNLLSGIIVPKLLDIATTTADAARVMWSGGNPYKVNLDTVAAKLMHDPRFGGYKYLPVMAFVYMPFVLAFGDVGTLIANAVMYTGATALVAYGPRSLNPCATSAAPGGALAALLFLCTPVVTVELLSLGATDIAPVLLLLGAMTQARRSPLLTGLLIGLSLSMKLTPAMFAVTIFFPWQRNAWSRYTAGLVLGGLPTLVYFLWAPGPFIDNIILFNGVRPADHTSWRYDAPAWAGQAAGILSLLAWLFGSLWCIIRQASVLTRVWTYTAVVLVVLLCASGDHNNYVTWWAPFLTVLIGRVGLPRSNSFTSPDMKVQMALTS